MNKRTLVLSAALLTILSSTVMAQSIIYLDVRPNDSGSTLRTITGNLGASPVNPFLNAAGNGDALNGGRRGQGQTLYLEPKAADGWESVNSAQKSGLSFPNFDAADDGANPNHATGNLWIYMDVNDDGSGVGDVISSVGLDIDTRFSAVTQVFRNKIQSMVVTLDNTNAVFNSITPAGGSPWNNKVDGQQVPASDPPDWEKTKAVRVPVDPGPTYNAALGIQPRAQGTTPSYRLGKIRLTAGTRSCTLRGQTAFSDYSTFDFFLKVNNLLITRVYNGAGDADERVQFGYSGASPEAPDLSGNTVGAVSAVADGRVQIRMKGDWTGDGNNTSADNPGQVAAGTDPADNQLQTYLGDFNGNNTVTSADLGSSGAGGSAYLHSLTRSGIASCP